MFATAAVVDAVRKEDRRRDLDRQLEEARQDLSDLRDRGASEAPKSAFQPTDLTIEQMDALWRSLKNIYNNRPYMKEIDKPATISASEMVSTLQSEYYGCPTEASMRAARRTDYERLEQAIMAEESDKGIVSRESRNKLHLFNESSSIEHLVRQLLRRAEILDKGSSPSPSFDEARQLAEKGCANFTFRSIDPGRAKKNTSLLNRRLRSLMDAPQLGVKERIGRICYNLLVSAHPPDMHTYNTLIVAFDKAGYHAFADALVNSFFHERLLRPTPSTFVAILNHYKATNNHGKFLRALACLTGADSKTGAKIGRRHVGDIENSPVLRKWAADTRLRTRTGDWVWDHVPLSRPLVEEVITGLLQFRLFDQAASFFVTCMRTGVAVSTSVVKQILDELIAALDWRAALRVIRGFSNATQQWKAILLTGDDATNVYLVRRIYSLLDLCGLHDAAAPQSKDLLANLNLSGNKLSHFFKTLEESCSELPPRAGSAVDDRLVARSASRLLQIESLWKEYVFVRKTTASIESKLLYPEFGLDFRAAMALHIGSTAIDRSKPLVQEVAAALADGSWSSEQKADALDECRRFEQLSLEESEQRDESIVDGLMGDATHRMYARGTASGKKVGSVAQRRREATNGLAMRHGPKNLLAWPAVSRREACYADGHQWAVGV
ncbi:pentatricopeptide repeat domain-containing protein [Purpureocillium lavendulum]|uniref:Pentatricopeptide repeat domain-containing protein n=1 Tax=Purpureocillium lavendulum TaxID=1247861 RepID=A0AB34FLJ6_9HYPO|nr:pentatricopeptide repeat domain-containing protein [Purpureocillium lavendulum]